MPTVKTIAVINQKGGVGKTTSVANLGAAIAQSGRRVCLVDLDPQSHLTLHLGIEPGSTPLSVYDLLTDDTPFADAAVEVDHGLLVVPAVIDLAAAEVELAGTVGREQILRDKLAETDMQCDYVMIDCPPSLGLLTLNALAAADEVVIPLQPHFLALQGLGKLLETVSLVRRRINPKLRVSGIMLCMFDTGTRLSGEVVADLTAFVDASRGTDAPWADARIFENVIRRNIKLAECPSHGKTIFDYEPYSNGADDYAALAEEFIEVHEAPAAPASAGPDAPAATAPDLPDQFVIEEVIEAPDAAAQGDEGAAALDEASDGPDRGPGQEPGQA
jgi:chromosome partitioning protein